MYEMFGYAQSLCVIFMDEIDAVDGHRFSEGASADCEIQCTLMEVCPSFLPQQGLWKSSLADWLTDACTHAHHAPLLNHMDGFGSRAHKAHHLNQPARHTRSRTDAPRPARLQK